MNKKIDEILSILQEECAELIQMVSKIRRFGEGAVHPEIPNKTNLTRFCEELGDVLALIEILEAHDYINIDHVNMLKHEKFDKLKKWTTINVDYNRIKDVIE
jgi:NTP pyrophosphatase (non-canonical NTP hydrolase)